MPLYTKRKTPTTAAIIRDNERVLEDMAVDVLVRGWGDGVGDELGEAVTGKAGGPVAGGPVVAMTLYTLGP